MDIGEVKKTYVFKKGEVMLEQIFQQEDSFCFLVGAGISLNSPSCLPIGKKFTNKLLEQLVPSDELKKIKKLMNHQRKGMLSSGNFLRFEQLVEYTRNQIDPDLNILNCYSNSKKPNKLHLILSQMLIQYKFPIFTTNFDNLLEYGLIESGVSIKKICSVNDQNDLTKMEGEDNYYVYKLHGSLTDFCTGNDRRNTIKTTLDQIASFEGKLFRLNQWKCEILEKFVKKHDIVILGYSGLDDFDIMPTLWNIKSEKRVIWIQHDSDVTIDNLTVETIDFQKQSDANNDYSRDDMNLIQFCKHKSRKISKIIRINVNTLQFLEWMGKRYKLQGNILEEKLSDKCDDFDLPLLNMKDEHKWYLTGKIYYDQNLFSLSFKAYKKALDLSKQNQNSIIEIKTLNNLGLFNETITPKNSVEKYRKAFRLSKESGNELMEILSLNNIIRCYIKLKKYTEAEENINKVLNLTNIRNYPNEYSTALHNHGYLFHVMNQMEKAIKKYKNAIDISKSNGIVWGIAISLNGLAVAIDESSDDLEIDTLKIYSDALELADKIGYLRGRATYLYHIGRYYLEKNNQEEALTNLTESYTLLSMKGMGYDYEIADTLYYIGKALYKQENWNDSLSIFTEAKKLAKKVIYEAKKNSYEEMINTIDKFIESINRLKKISEAS